MSRKDAKTLAQQYLKKQAQIIQKYGQAPKLHGDRYQEALTETKKTFEALSANKKS